MTREQKLDMFAMRLDGYTLQEIGTQYGITGERVRQILSSYLAPRHDKGYVYPNISAWMAEDRITISRMAEESTISKNTISEYLRGYREPHMLFIRYILQKSGMLFEEAFARKEPEQGGGSV